MTLTRHTLIAYGMPGMPLAMQCQCLPSDVLLPPAYASLPQLSLASIRSAFLVNCTIYLTLKCAIGAPTQARLKAR